MKEKRKKKPKRIIIANERFLQHLCNLCSCLAAVQWGKVKVIASYSYLILILAPLGTRTVRNHISPCLDFLTFATFDISPEGYSLSYSRYSSLLAFTPYSFLLFFVYLSTFLPSFLRPFSARVQWRKHGSPLSFLPLSSLFTSLCFLLSLLTSLSYWPFV